MASTRTFPVDALPNDLKVKSVIDDFEINAANSDKYNFDGRKVLLDNAVRHVWKAYFADSPMFYLHRDLQRRNILKGIDGIYAIDALGIIGPKEFEYTLNFIIEARAYPDRYVELHNEMLDYFSEYCDRKRLLAALFITWVHKMDEYVFSKTDEQKLAKWCLGVVEKIFYAGDISTVAGIGGIAVPEMLH